MTLRREPRIRWDALTFLIGLLLLWAFASWAWSAHRGTTARELIRLSIYLGVAAALACRFDLRRLCMVFAIAFAGSALTAVGYEIITGGFKPWQADYRLTGTMHSNALAIQAGVVAIIAYAFAARGNERKFLWYAIFLAAVAIVVLTKTRTALATRSRRRRRDPHDRAAGTRMADLRHVRHVARGRRTDRRNRVPPADRAADSKAGQPRPQRQ